MVMELHEKGIFLERLHMRVQNTALGTLCIVLGSLLFILSAGQWMIQFALAILSLYIINYGLKLRGMPPLTFLVLRWFDRTKHY